MILLSKKNIRTPIYSRFKVEIANFDLRFQQLIQTFPDVIYGMASEPLRPILGAYQQRYQFMQDNVYYDSKAIPLEHMRTFYELARLFDLLEIRPFNCFPLRRTRISSYVIIASI